MTYLLPLFVFTLLLADLFNANLSLGPGLSVKNAFLYVLMLVLAFRFVLAQRRPIELLSIPVCFAVLIAYAGISVLLVTFFADYPEFTPFGAVIALKANLVDHLIFFLVFFYGVSKTDDTLRVLRALLVGMILINVLTLFDVFVGGLGVIRHKGSGRMYGAFGDPNQTATVLVTFLPALVTEMVAGRRWARAFWGGGVASCMIILMMTASRGGFLSLIVATIVGVVLLRRYLSLVALFRWGVLMVAGAVLTVGLLSVQLREMFSGRILSGTFAVGLTESSSGRDIIWRAALDKLFEAPWSFVTGLGWTAYDSMAFWAATHSEYLRLWFDLGLPGLCLFVLIFVLAMRIAYRAVPIATGIVRGHLLAAIVGLIGLMSAVALVNLFDVWGYVWAYVGLVMRLAMIARENTAARSIPSPVRTATVARGTEVRPAHLPIADKNRRRGNL